MYTTVTQSLFYTFWDLLVSFILLHTAALKFPGGCEIFIRGAARLCAAGITIKKTTEASSLCC